MLVSAALLIALGTWCSYNAGGSRTDQYQLIHLGKTVYDGGRMYIDCWENKPPGLAWINALALAASGGWLAAPWILPGVIGCIAVAVFYWALKSILGLIPAVAIAFLASVLISTRDYDTPSINPDFYCAMNVLLASSLQLSAQFGSPRWPRLMSLTSGLCWAAAAAMKQTGPLGLLALSLLGGRSLFARKKPTERPPNLGLLTWLGFLTGVSFIAVILAWRGTFSEAMHAIFGFNQSLLSPRAFWESLGGWARIIGYLRPLELPLWLMLIGIAGAVLRSRHLALSRMIILALACWWIAEEWFALVGPSATMRYWQATWPPMLWLAGCGIAQLVHFWRDTGRGRRWMLAIVLATLAFFLGAPLKTQYFHGLGRSIAAYYSSEPSQRDRLREIGRYVREQVPPGQKIYVMRYDTGVYLYADRPAAVRFTNIRSLDQEREAIERLESNAATAILIPKNQVQLRAHFAASTLQRFDALLSSYENRGDIGGYQLMVLRGGP